MGVDKLGIGNNIMGLTLNNQGAVRQVARAIPKPPEKVKLPVALAAKAAFIKLTGNVANSTKVNLQDPVQIFISAANNLTGINSENLNQAVVNVAKTLNTIQANYQSGYKPTDATRFTSGEPNLAITELAKLAETMCNVQKQEKVLNPAFAYTLPGLIA